ncbi:MAG: YceD family protein [bacterium]|jgi:uncharacterized metal-binding protein YceD (DUF177 family)
MPDLREYEIAFVGLKPGTTVYEYEIGDEFFEAEKPADFNKCNALVKLSLNKHQGFMQLKFEVGGNTEMQCNRCGNPLGVTLWDDFEIVVKLVDNPDEMNDSNEDPDVFFISRTESHINVKNWLTEFVQLSMPAYPACAEEEIGGPKCNKEVLAMLNKLKETEEKNINPIWKGLDKFKDN